MDRKKTILIAVMINAGLLAVLFVAALTNQEEISTASVEMAESSLQKIDRPLFPDTADAVLQQPTSSPATQIPLVQIPLAEAPSAPIAALPNAHEIPSSQEPLVHKLPQLVQENPSLAPSAPTSSRTDSPYLEITVKKGDSLDKIAKAHNTTIDEIIKINQLPSSFLKVGQVLKLPTHKVAVAPKSKPAPEKSTVAAGPEYYTVKVGDNPWTIAMKHHLKVDELLKLNNLNEERARKLKPGDRLRIK